MSFLLVSTRILETVADTMKHAIISTIPLIPANQAIKLIMLFAPDCVKREMKYSDLRKRRISVPINNDVLKSGHNKLETAYPIFLFFLKRLKMSAVNSPSNNLGKKQRMNVLIGLILKSATPNALIPKH